MLNEFNSGGMPNWMIQNLAQVHEPQLQEGAVDPDGAAAEAHLEDADEADVDDDDDDDEAVGDEPQAEPAAGLVGPQVNNNDAGNNAGGDQWQPFELQDELTWERLLGLDGSLVFLEHVFWVISLNTLFILVFGE